MSEEQHNHRIDDEPTEERKAELEAAYQENITQDKAPYANVWIQTYGELRWVFEQRQWSGEPILLKGMQRPNLSSVFLEAANLSKVALMEANLSKASLSQVDLSGAIIEKADLREVVMERANLSKAALWGADLSRASLVSSNLSGAELFQANLSNASLSQADLNEASFNQANLGEASLLAANLSGAKLIQTNLSKASLLQANLSGASLEGANLSEALLRIANLSGASLHRANLSGASLMRAKFDSDTNLADSILSSATTLRDIRWNGVNLTQINWETVQHLGDDNKQHPDTTARAYRQVATQLRSQGLNEVADRFAYQAQQWQRRIMRQRLRWTNLRNLGPYLGSLLLWAVSGYGYRPGRTFATYLLVILAFAASFYTIGQSAGPHLSVLSAVIFSITSFHGRGFFPGGIALDDPLTVAAAGEAIIGLLVEVTFIATFTQRFFAR